MKRRKTSYSEECEEDEEEEIPELGSELDRIKKRNIKRKLLNSIRRLRETITRM